MKAGQKNEEKKIKLCTFLLRYLTAKMQLYNKAQKIAILYFSNIFEQKYMVRKKRNNTDIIAHYAERNKIYTVIFLRHIFKTNVS